MLSAQYISYSLLRKLPLKHLTLCASYTTLSSAVLVFYVCVNVFSFLFFYVCITIIFLVNFLGFLHDWCNVCIRLFWNFERLLIKSAVRLMFCNFFLTSFIIKCSLFFFFFYFDLPYRRCLTFSLKLHDETSHDSSLMYETWDLQKYGTHILAYLALLTFVHFFLLFVFFVYIHVLTICTYTHTSHTYTYTHADTYTHTNIHTR